MSLLGQPRGTAVLPAHTSTCLRNLYRDALPRLRVHIQYFLKEPTIKHAKYTCYEYNLPF